MINNFDYNVKTAPATDESSLFSAAVNIVISKSDFVFLGLSLIAPVVIYFVLKLLTKKML